MSATLPKISFIIPARNEGAYIGKCIDSLANQGYPIEKIEILVVNGASEDNTEEIVNTYAAKGAPTVKLFQNPKRFTPISMNIGVKNATGEIIMIIGAHSELEAGYVEKCVHYLDEYKADVVGGTLITKPVVNTPEAKAIVAALTSFFGTGGSRFRIGTDKVIETDAVFNGCYRKSVFDRVGLYNENLTRSQDIELNLRLKRAGGKIILAPDIHGVYYPKDTFRKFWQHNITDGMWAVIPFKFGVKAVGLRHLVPLFFVAWLIALAILTLIFPAARYAFWGTLLIYFATAFFFAAQTAKKEKETGLTWFIVVAYAIRHFGYGIGSLAGLFKLV